MKLPSWYECIENAREASLEITASLLDAHASLPSGVPERCEGCHVEGAHHRCASGPARDERAPRHHRGGGDFLFDFLRVNMNYASQVAMLGSSYASVMSRGLSRLCARPSSAGEPSQRCEVEFRAPARGTDTTRFSVRNRLNSRAELEIGSLTNGRLSLEFEEIGRPGITRYGDVALREESGEPFRSASLAPGETRSLLVTLDFRHLDANRRYRSELPARLGGRWKPIHLIAEVFP